MFVYINLGDILSNTQLSAHDIFSHEENLTFSRLEINHQYHRFHNVYQPEGFPYFLGSATSEMACRIYIQYTGTVYVVCEFDLDINV